MRSKPGQLGLSPRDLPGPRDLALNSQNVLGAERGSKACPILSSTTGHSDQGSRRSFCLCWNLIISSQGCD